MLYLILIVIICIILFIMYQIYNVSYIDSSGFYDIQIVYPALIKLEDVYTIEIIKQELSLLEENNWKEWPEYDLWKNKNARWTVFPLFGFNKWSNDSLKCPKLTHLLKSIPGLRTAGFSRMSAGTSLVPHIGYAKLSNYILRSHLLLTEHEPEKSIVWVNGEMKSHIYNKWITFDDSLLHYAANRDVKDRIVLLVDIDRPSFIQKGTSTYNNSDEIDNFIKNM